MSADSDLKERNKIAAAVSLLLAVPFALWDAWILWLGAKWWGPDFHLPPIHFGQAAVLSFFVGYLVFSTGKATEPDLTKVIAAQVSAQGLATITLGILGLVVR